MLIPFDRASEQQQLYVYNTMKEHYGEHRPFEYFRGELKKWKGQLYLWSENGVYRAFVSVSVEGAVAIYMPHKDEGKPLEARVLAAVKQIHKLPEGEYE